MSWDLFKQQPLVLLHPADVIVVIAAVSPVPGGIAFWNADYIIGQNAPGGGNQGGSGFACTQVAGKPRFALEKNQWAVESKQAPGWVYTFTLPDESLLERWQTVSKYIPSREYLNSEALRLRW